MAKEINIDSISQSIHDDDEEEETGYCMKVIRDGWTSICAAAARWRAWAA